jgi:hypothetical protein
MGLFDRIFGGDDDADGNDVTIDLSGDEPVVEGADAPGVTVTEGDPTGFLDDLEDGSWFAAHDIPAGGDDADDSAGATNPSVTGPTSPTEPPAAETVDPPEQYPAADADTVLLPTDPAVLQALEIRAKNGASERVETAYALTGERGRPPQDLWALDDPDLYEEATRTRLVSYGRRIAEHVASGMSHPPGQVVRVHTHPPTADPNTRPSTMPSNTDIDSAAVAKEQFVDAFGVGADDLVFSHGIHAYYPHDREPVPEQPRRARALDNGIAWRGEQYRHALALYDETFRNERQVELVGPSADGGRHG